MEALQGIPQVVAHIVAFIVHLRHLGWVVQQSVHTRLVQRPGVDVGVYVVVACRAEQPGLTLLPIVARQLPGLAGGLHVGGGQRTSLLLRADVDAQAVKAHGGVGHTLIRRNHGLVGKVGHYFLQGLLLGRKLGSVGRVIVVTTRCHTHAHHGSQSQTERKFQKRFHCVLCFLVIMECIQVKSDLHHRLHGLSQIHRPDNLKIKKGLCQSAPSVMSYYKLKKPA